MAREISRTDRLRSHLRGGRDLLSQLRHFIADLRTFVEDRAGMLKQLKALQQISDPDKDIRKQAEALNKRSEALVRRGEQLRVRRGSLTRQFRTWNKGNQSLAVAMASIVDIPLNKLEIQLLRELAEVARSMEAGADSVEKLYKKLKDQG